MKAFKKISLILGSVALILASCESVDPLDQVGPRICPSEGFSFSSDDIMLNIVSSDASEVAIETNSSEISLEDKGLRVIADFGEVVSWNLTISMEDGSAEKKLSGFSDNINYLWYGTSEKLPLFKTGSAKVSVEVFCFDAVSKSFEITKDPKFKGTLPEFGFLLRDYDQNGVFPVETIGTPAFGWGTGDGFRYGGNKNVLTYINTEPSPMGGYYANMKGDDPSTQWYFGETGFAHLWYNNFVNEFDKLPTKNADSLWFNVFVKGDQAYDNNQAILVFTTANGTFQHLEHVNWEGWKLMSVPFSSFKEKATNETMVDLTGFEEGFQTFFSLGLGSQPLIDNEAHVCYDFSIITVGEPFLTESE